MLSPWLRPLVCYYSAEHPMCGRPEGPYTPALFEALTFKICKIFRTAFSPYVIFKNRGRGSFWVTAKVLRWCLVVSYLVSLLWRKKVKVNVQVHTHTTIHLRWSSHHHSEVIFKAVWPWTRNWNSVVRNINSRCDHTHTHTVFKPFKL